MRLRDLDDLILQTHASVHVKHGQGLLRNESDLKCHFFSGLLDGLSEPALLTTEYHPKTYPPRERVDIAIVIDSQPLALIELKFGRDGTADIARLLNEARRTGCRRSCFIHYGDGFSNYYTDVHRSYLEPKNNYFSFLWSTEDIGGIQFTRGKALELSF